MEYISHIYIYIYGICLRDSLFVWFSFIYFWTPSRLFTKMKLVRLWAMWVKSQCLSFNYYFERRTWDPPWILVEYFANGLEVIVSKVQHHLDFTIEILENSQNFLVSTLLVNMKEIYIYIYIERERDRERERERENEETSLKR